MLAHALALAIALAAPADPGTTPDVEARIRALLNPIDRPVAPERFQELGPAAVPVLSRIASSAAERGSTRANALAALAMLGGPEAERTHLALARDPAAPWNVRLYAIRGAAHLLPPDRIRTEVEPVLSGDADARVRAEAADVIASRAPDGCAAVRAQVDREPAHSRPLVGRALQKCK